MITSLGSLSDNSFLTHLATGRLILERGSVPSVDPYTFTAPGEPWVVQSWLMSVVYATAEAFGGLDAIRVLSGLLAGTVGLIGWLLLRPVDGLVARLALAALFVVVGVGVWAERPLMVGLVAFGITMLAAEGVVDARWLVPVGWIWTNSHGSFPLAVVYLALVAVGARLDGRSSQIERRSLLFAVAGIVVGVLGPLGVRAMTFPVQLLAKQDVLSNIVEWQAPQFTSLGQRAFLLQLLLAVVLLAHRPSYRSALVLGVFPVAAMLGARNISVASMALLPGMAIGAFGVGSILASTRPRAAWVAMALVAGTGLLGGVTRLQDASIRLDAYPVDPLAFLDDAAIDTTTVRLGAPDFVGNLLGFVYGTDGRVFYDDRFDMYPRQVTEAQLALTKAQPDMFAAIGRYDIDLVVARRSQPAARVLISDAGWRTLYTDERWVLSCRRGADLDGTLGTC